MELSRRKFLYVSAAVAAGCVLGVLPWRNILSARFTAAERPSGYPGKVAPLNQEKMRMPAHWAG
jgi:hypothetical protein